MRIFTEIHARIPKVSNFEDSKQRIEFVPKVCGTDLVVVDPTAPWVGSSSDEEEYAEYQKYLRKIEGATQCKDRVRVGAPVAAVNKLFSM